MIISRLIHPGFSTCTFPACSVYSDRALRKPMLDRFSAYLMLHIVVLRLFSDIKSYTVTHTRICMHNFITDVKTFIDQTPCIPVYCQQGETSLIGNLKRWLPRGVRKGIKM